MRSSVALRGATRSGIRTRRVFGHGVLCAVLLMLLGCSAGHGGRHGHGYGHGDHATVRHGFGDAEKWAERFEDPERDFWQAPDQVIEWLDLESSSRVVDIGAATGYFPIRIAEHVPEGVVYGVDVEPSLVNYLNLRAHREGVTNLVGLVCDPDNPLIPEPVDVVFVCNTYHHIDARIAYFRRLGADLRDGGRIVIVDFKPGDFPVGPRDDHKIPPDRVNAELTQAGYRLTRQEELEYQYVLVFSK